MDIDKGIVIYNESESFIRERIALKVKILQYLKSIYNFNYQKDFSDWITKDLINTYSTWYDKDVIHEISLINYGSYTYILMNNIFERNNKMILPEDIFVYIYEQDGIFGSHSIMMDSINKLRNNRIQLGDPYLDLRDLLDWYFYLIDVTLWDIFENEDNYHDWREVFENDKQKRIE